MNRTALIAAAVAWAAVATPLGAAAQPPAETEIAATTPPGGAGTTAGHTADRPRGRTPPTLDEWKSTLEARKRMEQERQRLRAEQSRYLDWDGTWPYPDRPGSRYPFLGPVTAPTTVGDRRVPAASWPPFTRRVMPVLPAPDAARRDARTLPAWRPPNARLWGTRLPR